MPAATWSCRWKRTPAGPPLSSCRFWSGSGEHSRDQGGGRYLQRGGFAQGGARVPAFQPPAGGQERVRIRAGRGGKRQGRASQPVQAAGRAHWHPQPDHRPYPAGKPGLLAPAETWSIDRQEPEPGFADDLKFIFSKLPTRKQVLLFSPRPGPRGRRPAGAIAAAPCTCPWPTGSSRRSRSGSGSSRLPRRKSPGPWPRWPWPRGPAPCWCRSPARSSPRSWAGSWLRGGSRPRSSGRPCGRRSRNASAAQHAEGRRPVLVSTF